MSEQHISDDTNNPNKWGRTKTFAPPWGLGTERSFLELRNVTRDNARRVPRVQNVVLALRAASGQFPDEMNAVFRWAVQLGAGGGGGTRFIVDAASTLQFSVSAETITIGLVCDSWGPAWPEDFEAPDFSVQAAALFADGNTSGDSPTFTQRWQIPAGETEVRLVAPYGATGFRILGEPAILGATGPFVADMKYSLEPTSGGTPLDQYDGEYLGLVRLASVPFPGNPASLLVENTSGDGLVRTGAIAWDMAL